MNIRTALALILVTSTISTAAATPAEEIAAAAKKLKENYSWTTRVTVPEGNRFRPGPTDGRIAGDVIHVEWSFGDTDFEAVRKGDRGAANSPQGGWQSVSDLERAEGPGQFLARFVRNLQDPASQLLEILPEIKDLSRDGDHYSGTLSPEAVNHLLLFRRRGQPQDGPAIKDPRGTAKLEVRDGVLVRIEYKLEGSMEFNNTTWDQDRTTTTEIRDVGTTRVDIPEGAKRLLE